MPVINVNEGVNVSVSINKGNEFDVTVNRGTLNGGLPGGNSNTLQYNNNGVFGGVPTATYNGNILNLGSNANVSITGGSNTQVLTTDGNGNLRWSTPATGSGTVTSVTGDGTGLGFSLSGTVTTSGNITLATPSDTALRTSLNIGNVANLNLNGNGAQYLAGNGTFVTANTGTVTSVIGDGTGLGFSLSGTVTSTGNITLATPSDTALRTSLNIGNVANLNLNANASQFLTGAGTFVAGNSGTVTSVVGNGTGLGFSLSGTVTSTGNITLATPSDTQLRTSLNIGNVANINLNSNNSQVLSGAGNWIAVGSGSVTQVDTSGSGLGFSLTGGPITGTGTVTLAIPTDTQLRTSLNIGNVANINLNGNGAQYLAGNGAFVAGNAGTVTSVVGDGSGLGFSLTGTVTSSGNITLAIPTDTGLRTSLNIGNVANLNLNGNANTYLNGLGNWANVATGEPIANAVIATTNSPMGFNAKTALTDTTISFNNSTRQFTITPTGATFDVWVSGTKYTKSAAESITIGNTTGSHYIYYGNTGSLGNAVDFYDLGNVAAVSIIYWNADTNTAQLFMEERHSTGLTPTEHKYLHTTRGAVIQFVPSIGFTITANTTGSGSSNTDAQISLSSGTIWDEDIQVNIVNSATPTANTFQQNLSQIPAFYRSGSSGAWLIDAPTAYPFKQGTTRPTYNLNTAGTWTTPDVTSTEYFVQWICATNNLNYPVISIMGQSQFGSLNSARQYVFGDMDLSGLPLPELRPLYGLIFQTANAYTNTPKARLREYSDIRLEQGTTATLGVNAVDVAFRETPATVFASDATSNTAWANVIGNFAGNINYTGANITLGPVANVHITGGSSNQVLTTNGTGTLSWTTPNVGTVTSVVGNGSGLGFSLSGTVTSTGNITLAAPSDTALRSSLSIGNVANINLNGNGSQVLAGNGSWVAQSGGGGGATDVLSPFLLMGA